MRSYSDLSKLATFNDRFEYLKLNGAVGNSTFGFDRYLNQIFYQSDAWRSARHKAILRDSNGDTVFDLGCQDRPIHGKVYVHHMNPIDAKSINDRNPDITNCEYLICCSKETHDAIHYGGVAPKEDTLIIRKPGDTVPWR